MKRPRSRATSRFGPGGAAADMPVGGVGFRGHGEGPYRWSPPDRDTPPTGARAPPGRNGRKRPPPCTLCDSTAGPASSPSPFVVPRSEPPYPGKYRLLSARSVRLAPRRPHPSGRRMPQPRPAGPPAPQGLYDPRFEHDACGVNFVVHMKGLRSHEIVQHGIGALCNLEHRGASGAEVNTGDGAGILIQIPDRFFRDVVDFDLPREGHYATGIAFLPADPDKAADAAEAIEKIVTSEGLRVLGWRDVPFDDSMIGSMARGVEPIFRQLFLAGDGLADESLERRAFIVRKRVEHELGSIADGGVYFPSLSCRTLVYKGMLTTGQLPEFFPDLDDDRVESALALVHSRFSTNTFPSWPLAHPFRYVAHNGEINTVQGNRNWMRAREALLAVEPAARRPRADLPDLQPAASDSATFDEALELLHMGGYSLPHAVLMMIPEAWENQPSMDAGEARLLPVPRLADGAVGRPRLDRLHRRHRHRRGARPQRPAPVAVLGHRRRPRDHGLRGRRPRRRPGQGRAEGPPPAGPHVPRRHHPGPHHRRRRDQAPPRRPSTPTASGSTPTWSTLDALPGAAPHPAAAPLDGAAPADVRVHHRGDQAPPRAHGPHRRRSRSARWAPTRRSPCSRSGRACCSTTSPSCSPRSPTRRSTPSARSWSPPSAAPSDPRATCSTRSRRRAARSTSPGRSSTTTSWPSSSTSTTTTAARLPHRGHPVPVPGGRGRRGPAQGPRPGPSQGQRRHRRRRQHPGAVRPVRRRRDGADPVAAVHRGRPPPPDPREDPHPGRPRRRDRRRPRGAPHVPPARVRRRRHQPLPGVRDHRGPHRRGRVAAATTPSRRSPTTSRRPARACSR